MDDLVTIRIYDKHGNFKKTEFHRNHFTPVDLCSINTCEGVVRERIFRQNVFLSRDSIHKPYIHKVYSYPGEFFCHPDSGEIFRHRIDGKYSQLTPKELKIILVKSEVT